MADLAGFLWGSAPQYLQAEGEVTIEGNFVRVVASFEWTSFLPYVDGYNVDPIWLALPRSKYNAADTGIDFIGGNEIPGLGTFIWEYFGEWPESDGYLPDVGYVGRLTVNGEDGHDMNLIRSECYDLLTMKDFFPSGVFSSGDMDLKWLMGGDFLSSSAQRLAGTTRAAPGSHGVQHGRHVHGHSG